MKARNYLDVVISNRIKRYRKAEAMSQEDMAHIMGISPAAYSERETNYVPFRFREIWLLCQEHHLDMSRFAPVSAVAELEHDL